MSDSGTSDGAKPTAAAGTATIVGDTPTAPFGLGGRARLERQLARAGIETAATPGAGDLVLSGARLYGSAVITALARAPLGTVLVDDEGRTAAVRAAASGAAAAVAEVADGAHPPPGVGTSGVALAGRYDVKLRKRADPTVLGVRDRAEAERALFDAAYKGVTDIVTKRVWPAPALAVTRWCAARGIEPNQVTWASLVLTVLAFALFWHGAFAAGLVAAWAMTFLDTVDGKLARVTLAGSRLGDVLDHGIDLVHPPFWWWAWAVGCASIGRPLDDGGLTLAVVVLGYVLQRGEEGLFLARFGLEMHVWRPFDSWFRQITARRNPNLLVLTAAALLGAPRAGLVAVAVWTALCFLVHLVRIGLAFAAARRRPLVSWLAEA